MLLTDYIKRFIRIVSTSSIDPEQHSQRLKLVERDIALPVKTVVLCITGYFLFFFEHQEIIMHGEDVDITLRQVKIVFIAYVIINIFGFTFYLFFNRWPLQMVHWVTLGMSIIDGLVLSALVVRAATRVLVAAIGAATWSAVVCIDVPGGDAGTASTTTALTV